MKLCDFRKIFQGFVQVRLGICLGQYAPQARVLAFDGGHGIVDQLAHLQTLGLRLGRHPKDIIGAVLIPVFQDLVPVRRFLDERCAGRVAQACSSAERRVSKASGMYFRKIGSRTTCLYSAASMWARSFELQEPLDGLFEFQARRSSVHKKSSLVGGFLNQRPPGYSFFRSPAVYDCAKLRGVDSNHRPPGYEPDELPLLYPATGVPVCGTSNEPVLYPTQPGASRIEKNLPAVQVHGPADPVVQLPDDQQCPDRIGDTIRYIYTKWNVAILRDGRHGDQACPDHRAIP